MAEPKTVIKDIESLREFIRLNRTKEEYFDHIMEKVARGKR